MRFKPCEFLGTTHKLSVSLHTVCIQYDYASNQHGVESSKSRGPVGDLRPTPKRHRQSIRPPHAMRKSKRRRAEKTSWKQRDDKVPEDGTRCATGAQQKKMLLHFQFQVHICVRYRYDIQYTRSLCTNSYG